MQMHRTVGSIPIYWQLNACGAWDKFSHKVAFQPRRVQVAKQNLQSNIDSVHLLLEYRACWILNLC
jgi:hypothetical protein